MQGYYLVFTAAVLWGLIGVFSRGILDTGLGATEIAFWRALLAGGVFLVHGAFTGSLKLLYRRDGVALVGFALVGVTFLYTSFIFAVETGGISLAYLLLYSAPAFVAILAWLLLGERLTRLKVVLVSLVLIGIILFTRNDGTGITATFTSVAWGLCSGLSYASCYIFGKWILDRYSPITVYAFVLPLGAVGLLPLVDFSPKPAKAWLLLIALAIVSTYLPYLLYLTGLKRVEASRAVLVATVEPVVAATLALAFFGERLGPMGLAGGGLILVAAVVSTWDRSSPRPHPSERRDP